MPFRGETPDPRFEPAVLHRPHPARETSRIRLAAFAFLFLLAAAFAVADTIRLTNGNVVSGRIVEERENEIRIDTGELTLTVLRKNIASVEKGQAVDFHRVQAQRGLDEGKALLAKGDTPKARRTFENALQDLDAALAEMDAPPPELADVRAQLDQARIDSLPKDSTNQKAEELYRQALVHLDHLEYPKALTVLQQASDLVPDRPDILLRLGDAARQVNEIDRAINAYKKTLAVDPDAYYDVAAAPLLKLLHQRVQKYLAERRADEAVDVYKDVILLIGTSPDKPVSLAEYHSRVAARPAKSQEELLKEVFRHADDSDLIDLSFAAIMRVEKLNPSDTDVKRLVAETEFLSGFKSQIDAGKVDEAGSLLVSASPEVVDSKRVQEKMKKIAGDAAPTIEAQTLLTRAKAAFDGARYKEARQLAGELMRKYPAAATATEGAELLKKADFEATIQESLDSALQFIEQNKDDKAEQEIRELLQYETIRDSLQFARLEELQARIPREREADGIWILAAADLDAKELLSARDRLKTLDADYGDTRAGRRAKKWLAEYQARLDREIARYKPTATDFFATLSDPSAWRPLPPESALRPAEGTRAVSTLPAVPEGLRLVAWKPFEDIMKVDLAGKVERRSHGLYIGFPLALGALLLLLFLWFHARPGSGKLGEAVAPDEQQNQTPDATPDRDLTTCRMCGQSVPPEATTCPACGTPSTLSAIESERALDENRLANLDPWEFRARHRNLTDFEPLFERAKELAEKGILSKAIESCRRALHEDPHRPSAYLFLAELYERQGRHEDAERCYQEILLLNPTEIVVRRKLHTLSAYSELSLDPGPVVIVLSAALWWMAFWLIQGLDPGLWILRVLLAVAGAVLTAILWKRVHGRKKIAMTVPRHHGAEKATPLPAKPLTWGEQNRQAHGISRHVAEHTGIEVPPLTIWPFFLALACSILLLAGLIGIAWYNHAPLVLLAWPAGAFLLFYLMEIHPRILTAHIVLRHLYEETSSPWVDPHRPFRPAAIKTPVHGEFLLKSPETLPVQWALYPRPYRMNRQGLLNSLQQALNRHWEFHRFYPNLRVVRDTEIPMPSGFKTAAAVVLAMVLAAPVGAIWLGAKSSREKSGYENAMTSGYRLLLDGEIEPAREAFTDALRRDPARIAPLLYLGHTQAAAGFVHSAERYLRAAAGRARDLPQIHNDLANFLQRQGRLRESLLEYNLALKTDPNNADILSNIGSAYFKRQDYAKAIDFLLPAVKSNPSHSRAHTTLGLALEAIGEKDRARKAFETALRVAPDQPYTRVARTRLDLNLEIEDTNPLRIESIPGHDAPASAATASEGEAGGAAVHALPPAAAAPGVPPPSASASIGSPAEASPGVTP